MFSNKARLFAFLFVLSLLFTFSTIGLGVEVTKEPRIPMKDALGFKTFESYNEAPMFKDGKFPLDKIPYLDELPPVEERLPKEVKVIKKAAMPDGIGEYGGIWRDMSIKGSPRSWNPNAGVAMGWFGLDDQYMEPLLSAKMATFLEEGMAPEPNLAKDWEWSEDKKTLTLHLLEGVKWSDGEEFTAEDVVFTYRDCYLNDNTPVAPAAGWKVGGEYVEMEKVDKYTVKVHLSQPSSIVFSAMIQFWPIPKHAYEQYHPKYNPDATWEDLMNAYSTDTVPVVLGPWIPYQYKEDQLCKLIRNPFYFKTDAEGNQLPYIDMIRYTYVAKARQFPLQLMAGNLDWANMDLPSQYPQWMKNREKGSYEVIIPRYHQLYNINFNLCLWEESLQNPTRDKAVRKIFRNEKFRQAVSHGIDRARLKAMWGNVPVIEPTGAAGVVRSSRFYNKEARTEYNYDPEKSEQLFEEIGLVDEDGDGVREFPEDSAMAGKDFTIYIEVGTDNNDGAMLSQLVARELQKLGIDAKMRQMESSLIGNLHDANHYDIAVDRGVDQTTPLVNLGSMVPIDEYSPWWHRASPEGKRELLPFEKKLRDLGEELTTTVGFEKQYELMSEVQEIFTENVYLIGLLHRSRPHAVAKRFRNVHPSNYKVIVDDRQQSLPFAMWVPKDLQLKYDI